MKVLVLSPHSDDGDLAMGGTIHKLVETGHEVIQVVMCASPYVSSGGKQILPSIRATEFMKAQEYLGSTGIWRPLDRENTLNLMSREALANWIQSLIEQYKPDRLYGPLPWFNQDHQAIWGALLVVFRRMPVWSWLGYEMPGQTWPMFPEPQFGWRYESLNPGNVASKMTALAQHQSQNLEREDTAVSLRGVLAMADYRGAEAGMVLAERFLLIREVSQ